MASLLFPMSLFAERNVQLFNDGWRFTRYGQMPDGTVRDEPEGLEQPDADTSGWRHVTLPHDWGIEGPFRPDLPNETGKLPWVGIGWYRKHFQTLETDRGRRVFIDFGGAMSHAEVWLNGKSVGGWPYGYSSFRLELTDHLKFGEENVLAVRLDNPPDSSRWYPGGGIYRNVWLVKTDPVHVAHWGTVVTTPNVSEQQATVQIVSDIVNQGDAPAEITVKHELFEAADSPVKIVEASAFEGIIDPGTNRSSTCSITLHDFKRWDVEHPNLYVVRTTICRDGQVVDTCKTTFGIRTFEFTADKGFWLNGRQLKLNGVCLHHDLGPLGAAVNARAIERQLEIMKEMGCNAVRTSHNPPAPELLAVCDRLGILVIDEAFDCWMLGKKKNDYGSLFNEWHERDLSAMIRRDRNHPSVILWSTGNEILEQWPDGRLNLELSRQLTEICHREDPTRPVTVGCNYAGSGTSGFQKTVDVFGYNYKPHLYGEFQKNNPAIPLYGSETASCISSRGEYFFPVIDDISKGCGGSFQVSSYDLFAPRWATTPDTEFEMQDRMPNVCGEFVWTGFDYLGEPTPYNQDETNLLNLSDPVERERMKEELERMGGNIPSRSSYFGIVDLCGFKKDRFYLYQSRWLPELPMVHILPHWNWPERIGEITPVHVYTSGDEAELFLNGTSLGRKTKGQYAYRLRWDDVVYEPGELKVIAFKNGQTWAEETVQTTGSADHLELSADRSVIVGDGADISFVTIKVADKDGRLVPRTHNSVNYTLAGPGEIIAVGSGDSTNHESFQALERKVFNGLALVVIRSKKGGSGEIVLTAKSDGLKSTDTVIKLK